MSKSTCYNTHSVTSNAVANALNGKTNRYTLILHSQTYPTLEAVMREACNQLLAISNFESYTSATVMIEWQGYTVINVLATRFSTDWVIFEGNYVETNFFGGLIGSNWWFYGNEYRSIPCSIKGNIDLNKYGKVVQLSYLQTDNSTFNFGSVNQWYEVAVLPEGFRPRQTIYIEDTGFGNCFRVAIYSWGSIQIYKSSGLNAGYEIAFNVTYVIT